MTKEDLQKLIDDNTLMCFIVEEGNDDTKYTKCEVKVGEFFSTEKYPDIEKGLALYITKGDAHFVGYNKNK